MSIFLRIALFFALACAFTWWPFVLPVFIPDSHPTNFALGPLIAAPVVILATEGRAGLTAWLKRIVCFRAPLWVYGTAFFIPLGIVVLSAILAISIGTPAGPLPVYSPLEMLIYLPLVLLEGPFPEEATFRGYGQQALQAVISPLAASLWIGLGVVVWHVPLFLAGEDPWMIAVTIVAVSVVYAWLYQYGGIWPAVIVHFTQNYFGGGVFTQIFEPAHRMPFFSFLTAIYILWAGLIVWRLGPSLGRVRQPA